MATRLCAAVALPSCASAVSVDHSASGPAASSNSVHDVLAHPSSHSCSLTRNFRSVMGSRGGSSSGRRRLPRMAFRAGSAAAAVAAAMSGGERLDFDGMGPELNFYSSLEGGATTTTTATTQAPAAQRSAEADVMGLMLRQRVVFLGHQVDDFVADAVISQLLLLDAVDSTKDIRLFVNCPGGAISAAMGIYDAIQLCRADVSTIAFGLAASTAAIVLAGGTKGKRFAMPNTRIMMHQPLGGASGQAIDVEIQAKEVMYHKSNITRIVAEITGRSFDQVSKDMDRDRYMSPVEAMEYGLIDGVIDKDTIIPLAPSIEKVKQRSTNISALEDPRKFLNPDVPDSEIY